MRKSSAVHDSRQRLVDIMHLVVEASDGLYPLRDVCCRRERQRRHGVTRVEDTNISILPRALDVLLSLPYTNVLLYCELFYDLLT